MVGNVPYKITLTVIFSILFLMVGCTSNPPISYLNSEATEFKDTFDTIRKILPDEQDIIVEFQTRGWQKLRNSEKNFKVVRVFSQKYKENSINCGAYSNLRNSVCESGVESLLDEYSSNITGNFSFRNATRIYARSAKYYESNASVVVVPLWLNHKTELVKIADHHEKLIQAIDQIKTKNGLDKLDFPTPKIPLENNKSYSFADIELLAYGLYSNITELENNILQYEVSKKEAEELLKEQKKIEIQRYQERQKENSKQILMAAQERAKQRVAAEKQRQKLKVVIKKWFQNSNNVGKTICKWGTIKYVGPNSSGELISMQFRGQLKAHFEKISPDAERIQFRMYGFAFEGGGRRVSEQHAIMFDQFEYVSGSVLWDEMDGWDHCK